MKKNVLELIVSSRDEEVISKVKSSLKNVDVQELPQHRGDILTIIGIAASLVKLISDLIDLYKKIKSKEIESKIIIKNIDGEQLDLSNSTEEEIENFVKRGKINIE